MFRLGCTFVFQTQKKQGVRGVLGVGMGGGEKRQRMGVREFSSSSFLCDPKVYTRTGDGGISSLFTGERVPKGDLVFDALGNADELNACLGLAREYCREEKNGLDQHLEIIQSLLFDVGACIATPPASAREAHLKRLDFSEQRVDDLEELIDEMEEELPPLRQFILPSGGKASSALHISRSVCRRAERSLSRLKEAKAEGEGDYPPKAVMKFTNRLSDFLFISARFAALKAGEKEIEYKTIKNK